MKKFLTVLFALILSVSAIACGGPSSNGGDDADKTVITVHIYNGGTGSQWLREASARFEEAYKNEVFEEGKTGVKIKITANQEQVIPTMATSGTNMYFYLGHHDVITLAQSQKVLNINSFLDEKYDAVGNQTLSIMDKLDEAFINNFKGADGNFYALPYVSTNDGLSYDVERFDEYNLYFAAPEETNVENVTTKFGSARFVKNNDAKKACGNDGVYGTDDDGLPTSLQEFLILCAQFKLKTGVGPITMSGQYEEYINCLILGVMSSLAGADKTEVLYNFNSDSYDVVDGYTTENLFAGVDYIKKPIVTQKPVTEATGYLAYDSVYRYYAAAFVEVLYREGFFSSDAETGTVSNVVAQENFVYNGQGVLPEMGMIIEGSWWHNEAEEKQNVFSNYYNETGTNKKVKWMSLPTSLNETAQPVANGEAARKAETYFNNGTMIINNNIKNNEALISAIKKFVQFLYSDTELQNFTVSTGQLRHQIKYTLSKENYDKLDDFSKSFYDFYQNTKLASAPDISNQTYLKNRETFAFHQGMPILAPTINGTKYTSYLQLYKSGWNSKDVFETTRIKEGDWNGYYAGN